MLIGQKNIITQTKQYSEIEPYSVPTNSMFLIDDNKCFYFFKRSGANTTNLGYFIDG